LTETAVYIILVRQDWRKLLLYSILINSFTNPLLNLIYNYYYEDLLLLEVLVTLIEAVMIAALMRLGLRRALMISAASNAVSLAVGLLIFFL
jgi:hypothetical protein